LRRESTPCAQIALAEQHDVEQLALRKSVVRSSRRTSKISSLAFCAFVDQQRENQPVDHRRM